VIPGSTRLAVSHDTPNETRPTVSLHSTKISCFVTRWATKSRSATPKPAVLSM
jgi:hypothetical protein